jgi:uncharacterized membrane-anchored protein
MPSLRRPVIEDAIEIAARGPAKVGKRTKDLTKRITPGDVAIIDHLDIDTVAADALVAAGPVAVLNASKSTSGRYPNAGPQILHDAGIIVVDDLGPEIMSLGEDSVIEVSRNLVFADGEFVGEGELQTTETISASQAAARAGLSDEIEAFADNTMRYLQKEKDLLLDGVGVPDISTKFAGRQALVVVRGHHYKEDLAMLRPFIKDNKPILIGVDGGADAILDAGYKLDMIVGDMDSVSDRALTSGAEIVVHAYRNGNAPGMERVEKLGVPAVVFPATGTSEDIAMLIADEKGAELIVAVGTHTTLVEYLDKGRSGMASTYLTRLRVGSKLVDAKGVSQLYRTGVSNTGLVLLGVAGILTMIAAMWATDIGRTFFGIIAARWDNILSWLARAIGA